MLASQRSRLLSRSQAQLETLHPATLVIEGHNISAGSGPQARQMILDEHGTLYDQADKAYRVRRELLTAAGVVILPQATTLSENGRAYRVVRVVDRAEDPCLYLACKEA